MRPFNDEYGFMEIVKKHGVLKLVNEYGMMDDENGMRWGIPSVHLSAFISRHNAGEKNLGPYAIKAIKEVAEMGYPIPEALLPWLNAACDAWIEKQGNFVSNYETDKVWKRRIRDTHRLVMGGYSPKKAFDAIADRDGVKSSSIKRHYYKDHAEERQVIEDQIADLKDWQERSGDDVYVYIPSTNPEEIL